MEEDLRLEGNQFQVAVSIFYVTCWSLIFSLYMASHLMDTNLSLDLLFEVPSNLILKPLTPSRYISFVAFGWGIIAMCTGFVHNYGALIAIRLILGVVEAGLFPGLNVYLTFFYTKRELALRVGYLFVSAAISGALGGLLAYGIGQMSGVAGYNGWRWIFIIEGLPSIVIGVATFFLLPNDIEHAYFLTPEEKKFAAARHMRHYGHTESAQKFSKSDMMAAFKDWKIWLFCLGQFGVDTMLYGELGT